MCSAECLLLHIRKCDSILANVVLSVEGYVAQLANGICIFAVSGSDRLLAPPFCFANVLVLALGPLSVSNLLNRRHFCV